MTQHPELTWEDYFWSTELPNDLRHHTMKFWSMATTITYSKIINERHDLFHLRNPNSNYWQTIFRQSFSSIVQPKPGVSFRDLIEQHEQIKVYAPAKQVSEIEFEDESDDDLDLDINYNSYNNRYLRYSRYQHYINLCVSGYEQMYDPISNPLNKARSILEYGILCNCIANRNIHILSLPGFSRYQFDSDILANVCNLLMCQALDRVDQFEFNFTVSYGLDLPEIVSSMTCPIDKDKNCYYSIINYLIQQKQFTGIMCSSDVYVEYLLTAIVHSKEITSDQRSDLLCKILQRFDKRRYLTEMLTTPSLTSMYLYVYLLYPLMTHFSTKHKAYSGINKAMAMIRSSIEVLLPIGKTYISDFLNEYVYYPSKYTNNMLLIYIISIVIYYLYQMSFDLSPFVIGKAALSACLIILKSSIVAFIIQQGLFCVTWSHIRYNRYKYSRICLSLLS
jgi:hypothetical protein